LQFGGLVKTSYLNAARVSNIEKDDICPVKCRSLAVALSRHRRVVKRGHAQRHFEEILND
jgi:hypothetical protein